MHAHGGVILDQVWGEIAVDFPLLGALLQVVNPTRGLIS